MRVLRAAAAAVELEALATPAASSVSDEGTVKAELGERDPGMFAVPERLP